MGKLEGIIALVAGGNSGIGLATAKQFVHEGSYVFITGRVKPELDAAVIEIGKNVTGVQGHTATFERWNIVNRVVPDDAFESQTRTLAERLANGPILAYAAGKRIVRAFLEGGVRAGDKVVNEVARPLVQSEDMRAGVAALVEYGARNFRDKVTFQGR